MVVVEEEAEEKAEEHFIDSLLMITACVGFCSILCLEENGEED
jgi:hypothetical protein